MLMRLYNQIKKILKTVYNENDKKNYKGVKE